MHITLSNIKPGYYERWGMFWIYNTGTLDGKLTIEINEITNKENGRTEPEIAAGDKYGPLDGELGDNLRIEVKGIRNLPIYVFGDWMGGRTLNYWGGKTSPVYDLASGAGCQISIYFKLPGGTGNIVQSDSVEFDIIFHLVQA